MHVNISNNFYSLNGCPARLGIVKNGNMTFLAMVYKQDRNMPPFGWEPIHLYTTDSVSDAPEAIHEMLKELNERPNIWKEVFSFPGDFVKFRAEEGTPVPMMNIVGAEFFKSDDQDV